MMPHIRPFRQAVHAGARKCYDSASRFSPFTNEKFSGKAMLTSSHLPPCPAGRPLVTDLDGTLLATDSMRAGFSRLAGSPLRLLKLVRTGWREGGLAVKWALVPWVLAEIGRCPLREEVVVCLRQAAASGRMLVLATASPQPVAEAVAEVVAARIGLFDHIFASDTRVNLIGRAKADALVAAFGERGFDYIGDSGHDVPVWRVAHTALVVGRRHHLARRANPRCLRLDG